MRWLRAHGPIPWGASPYLQLMLVEAAVLRFKALRRTRPGR